MAMNPSTLESDIKSLITNNKGGEDGIKEFSSGLAKLITDYIKTADISIESASCSGVIVTPSGPGSIVNQPVVGTCKVVG